MCVSGTSNDAALPTMLICAPPSTNRLAAIDVRATSRVPLRRRTRMRRSGPGASGYGTARAIPSDSRSPLTRNVVGASAPSASAMGSGAIDASPSARPRTNRPIPTSISPGTAPSPARSTRASHAVQNSSWRSTRSASSSPAASAARKGPTSSAARETSPAGHSPTGSSSWSSNGATGLPSDPLRRGRARQHRRRHQHHRAVAVARLEREDGHADKFAVVAGLEQGHHGRRYHERLVARVVRARSLDVAAGGAVAPEGHAGDRKGHARGGEQPPARGKEPTAGPGARGGPAPPGSGGCSSAAPLRPGDTTWAPGPPAVPSAAAASGADGAETPSLELDDVPSVTERPAPGRGHAARSWR